MVSNHKWRSRSFSLGFVGETVLSCDFGSFPYFVTYMFTFVASVCQVCKQFVSTLVECFVSGADASQSKGKAVRYGLFGVFWVSKGKLLRIRDQIGGTLV